MGVKTLSQLLLTFVIGWIVVTLWSQVLTTFCYDTLQLDITNIWHVLGIAAVGTAAYLGITMWMGREDLIASIFQGPADISMFSAKTIESGLR